MLKIVDLKTQEIIRQTRTKISGLRVPVRYDVREARSFNGWTDKPVSAAQLRDIYDLMKLCPTGSSTCPIRLICLSDNAKKILE